MEKRFGQRRRLEGGGPRDWSVGSVKGDGPPVPVEVESGKEGDVSSVGSQNEGISYRGVTTESPGGTFPGVTLSSTKRITTVLYWSAPGPRLSQYPCGVVVEGTPVSTLDFPVWSHFLGPLAPRPDGPGVTR